MPLTTRSLCSRLLAAAVSAGVALPGLARAEAPAPSPAPSAVPGGAGWLEYDAGAAVPSGYIVANVAGRGTMLIPLSDLQRHYEYKVDLQCYGPGEDGAERLVCDNSMVLLGGSQGAFLDTRTRIGYNPQQVENFERQNYGYIETPERQPAMDVERILASSDPLPLDDSAGALPRTEREHRLLAASDVVRCGDMTFYVYQPRARRLEAQVERREVLNELVYVDGVPQVVQHATEFEPHGWVKCSLDAGDLGFLFEDGTPLPSQEEDAALEQRVKERSAGLLARRQE